MKDFDFRQMCRLINAFGKVRRRERQKKEIKKNTFEAGMCMKTNKYTTKCPEKIGHLCLRFGHLRLTDTNFAEIRGEFTLRGEPDRKRRRSRHGRDARSAAGRMPALRPQDLWYISGLNSKK